MKRELLILMSFTGLTVNKRINNEVSFREMVPYDSMGLSLL